MAKPGQPFDKEEEQIIQEAIEAYQQKKRDAEINAEIQKRISDLEYNSKKKK